jgi:hypothetical protein
MKTERRHELHSNWLADHVDDLVIKVRPYTKAIFGVILAGVVLWAAYLFMEHRAQADEANNWNKLWNGMLGGLGGQEMLETLADSSSKQPTTDWARLVLADSSLFQGSSMWFAEKAAARNALNTALENYQSVLKNSTDPLVREQALYGVGRANEALCKLDDARAAYEQLEKDYPNGTYATRASQRLESLSRDSTKARYDWFANVVPPASALSKPGDNSLSLPSELEPLSQFSTSKPSTPPPAPTPDLATSVPSKGETKPLNDGTLLKLPSPTGIEPKVQAVPELSSSPAANKPASTAPAGKSTRAASSPTKPADNSAKKPASTAPSANK